jgi:uncharacterized protein
MRMYQSLLVVLIPICSLLCMPQAKAQQSNSLFAAVKNNDIKELRSLLHQGADANACDDDSDNVLMYAAIYSSIDVMQMLLENGSKPDVRNRLGETALMWSAHDPDKIKLLLQHGADINAKAKSGNTILLIACVGYGKYDIIKMLLDKGADPLTKNVKKETALMRASIFGDTATISLLLSKSIDVNAQDQDGNTALINAVLNSNRSAVFKLLEHGADPEIAMSFGLTALSCAVIYNDIETVNAILKKIKNVNAIHADGHTALMWATYNEYDNISIIQALLDKGADVNMKATDGSTALSWALKKGNTATVSLLKKSGAK